MKKISKLDEYLFDLNGYLIIKNALSKKELINLNKTKLLNSEGIAIMSEIKKKPAISSRLF